MAPDLDPEDVLDVAAQLHRDHGELVPDEWTGVADARFRSSVSRAYYAAFLFLKRRLEAARSWPNGFPQDNVHRKVLRAVQQALPPNHSIPAILKSLLEQRATADYDLKARFDRIAAEDRCDESDVLIRRIENLSSQKIGDIANRL